MLHHTNNIFSSSVTNQIGSTQELSPSDSYSVSWVLWCQSISFGQISVSLNYYYSWQKLTHSTVLAERSRIKWALNCTTLSISKMVYTEQIDAHWWIEGSFHCCCPCLVVFTHTHMRARYKSLSCFYKLKNKTVRAFTFLFFELLFTSFWTCMFNIYP